MTIGQSGLCLCLVACVVATGKAQSSEPSFISFPARDVQIWLKDPSDALLPDAPTPQEVSATSPQEAVGGSVQPVQPAALAALDDFQISQKCAAGLLDKQTCKFQWWPALGQLSEFLVVEQGWNISTNYWIRKVTFRGHWLQDYFKSLEGFHFGRWDDDNPWYDDYVGHPMMGAIAMDIYLQNDPRGKSIELENSKAYWHSRLQALLWSAVYSAQWKLGPISEASIGNTGYVTFTYKNALSNGTGSVGLVVTPAAGWIWSMGEDVLDQQLISRLERKSQNPVYLFMIEFINPCRGFSNLLRYKAPWYRDTRPVRARWRSVRHDENH